jgi:hypothetical protein
MRESTFKRNERVRQAYLRRDRKYYESRIAELPTIEDIKSIIDEWYEYLPEGIISSPIQIKYLAQAIYNRINRTGGPKC